MKLYILLCPLTYKLTASYRLPAEKSRISPDVGAGDESWLPAVPEAHRRAGIAATLFGPNSTIYWLADYIHNRVKADY